MEAISISRTLPAAGRCVYCGKRPPEVVLTLEHIIPRGLKGYIKLPEGSCTGCASITKKFEQVALRKMLGDARVHTGLGWGEKKEQPQTHVVQVKTDTGFEKLVVPTKDHPFILAMIDLPPPRMLSSFRQGGVHKKIRVSMFGIQDDAQERVDRIGKGQGVRLMQTAIVPEFLQMLAKIAHSYAAAFSNETGQFRAFLPTIIRGDLTNVCDLIGGADEHMPPTTTSGVENILHDIWLSSAKSPSRLKDPPFIVASVHLFACFKMPVYQVVVGQCLPDQLR